jgi:cytochrome c oxidase subunit 4
MSREQENSNNPRVDFEYRRRRNAEDMKFQVVSFALMIFLTVIAFGSVYADFTKWFTIPFIFLLAVVQVAFQIYYFMHMSHKGHEGPQLFIYAGVFIAFTIILTFITIIWW